MTKNQNGLFIVSFDQMETPLCLKNSAIPMAARQAPVSEPLIFAVPIAMCGIPIAMGAIRIAMDSTRRSNYCKDDQ